MLKTLLEHDNTGVSTSCFWLDLYSESYAEKNVLVLVLRS